VRAIVGCQDTVGVKDEPVRSGSQDLETQTSATLGSCALVSAEATTRQQLGTSLREAKGMEMKA
jgi:hypothetical protein